MNERVAILCVDDEPNVLRALERVFIDDDYEIITAGSGAEGLDILSRTSDISLVMSDYRMPGMNGVEFLKEVYVRQPDTVRIVLSGYADTAAVVGAINEGQIYKFIPKPWNDDELRVTVIKAIDAYFLKKKNDELSEELRVKNEELSLINENLERLMTERISDIIIPSHAQVLARAILKQLPVGVIEIASGCIISQINDEAARLLGLTRRESTGIGMEEVLPDPLCRAVKLVREQGTLTETALLDNVGYIVRGRTIDTEDGKDTVLVLHPGGTE